MCGLLCAFAKESHADETRVYVPLTDGSNSGAIGHSISVLKDSTGSMELADVMAVRENFSPVNQAIPSLGFQQSAHWFHVRVDSKYLGDEEYLFHIEYGFLDDLSFYEVHEGVLVQSFQTGDNFPFSLRPEPYENFIFPLKLESSQLVDLYFRVVSTESILLPLEFVSRVQQRDDFTIRNYIFGALFGAMLLIVLYNFFLWLIILDKPYLYYWLYLLAQACFQFMYSGYAFRYWWPENPEFQIPSLVFGGLLIGVLGLDFCRSYLNTPEILPRADLWLRRLKWTFVCTSIPAYLLSPQIGMVFMSVFSFAVPFSALCVVFRLTFYERSALGAYMFTGFFVLLFSFCVQGIAALGFVEFSRFTLHLPPLAVVIEGAVLSLGLAHRIRTLQVEKSKTLILLLEESTRAARLGASAQRFVPHEFLDFLGHTDISQVLVGDSTAADMTVLFSDIRSFTTLSEGMSPKENFEFVNEYLHVVTPVIYRNGGFVDKFIGDAVMALFHQGADNACRCALEMQEAIEQYNEKRAEEGKQPVHSGIGIHTGSVMLGTVGDEKRLQTTVISDAVNLASRIEGLTKEYGRPVLISEAVVNSLEAPKELSLKCLDSVSVKGKAEEVTIYQLNAGP